MRILAITKHAYLGDLYLSLLREGHEVRVQAPGGIHVIAGEGLFPTVREWRPELHWVGHDGVILVEHGGEGALQDALRADGYRVVGGSGYGDRLERDRAFGQAVLRDTGLQVAEGHAFPGPIEAASWLALNPGRYVLKHDDNAHSTYVGQHAGGADLAWRLARTPPGRVVLQPRLDGVEIGVGAYFNGTRFLRPANLDFEHKRFFPGDLGEMTGEMGTLATFDGAEALFAATLERMESRFAAAGHVGYVNLNMIANRDGMWPLEFTCRFGNPGFAVLAALQTNGWGDLLARMADGEGARFRTLPGWSVALVLTTPPFPAWGVPCVPDDDPPLTFHTPPDPVEIGHYRPADLRHDGDVLRVHRRSGHAMIVTGTGATVSDAQHAAQRRARNVIAPDLRWRTDIGDRFLAQDRAMLESLGLLDANA